MMSVTQAIRNAVQQRGDDLAIVCGDRARTWRQWLADISRLAAGFQTLGLQHGDRVALLAFNSDHYIDIFFATAWAGGVIVPINTRLSASEVAYILAHADVSLICVEASFSALLDTALGEAGITPVRIGVEAGFAPHDISALILANEACADAGRCDGDLSGIFYTGGTTGRSKGVMTTHANHVVHSLGMWSGRAVEPRALRFLHAAPMFHIADGEFIYGVSVIGGTHHVIPRFEAANFLKTVADAGITDAVLVPTMVQMLLDHPDLSTSDTRTLKRLWYGGSPMPEATIERLRAALPHCAPIQLYGQTEAGPIITILEAEDHDPPASQRQRRRSAGRAMPGCEIRVVDETGATLPIGQVGEILARSGSVMLGYWRDEVQTAAALQDGWLHTGDAGHIDADGYLYVTDRFKDMIITGGENVFSTEVEQIIYQCAGIAQCAVIGVPDARWGERIHAVLVPQPGHTIDVDEVAAKVRAALAGYKVPRSFEIRDAMPLSGAGKILKRELRLQVSAAAQA